MRLINSNKQIERIILILVFLFSLFNFSICQNISYFNDITEDRLLQHYKDAGMKYSIEGIWIIELEATTKMYTGGNLILNDTRILPNKSKKAFVSIGNKIYILSYDRVKTTYSVSKDNFIMPTPNKYIYNYTMPSTYDYEIGIQFEEFNTEIVVKDYFINYTVSPQPANEKAGEEIIMIVKHTGYKLAPIE